MTSKTPKVELIAEIKKLGFNKKVSRLWTYSREKLERILNELKGTKETNGTKQNNFSKTTRVQSRTAKNELKEIR